MAIGSSGGSIDLSASAPVRSVASPWGKAGQGDPPGDVDELASVEVAYLASLAGSARVIPQSLTRFLR